MATIALLGAGKTGGKVLDVAGDHTIVKFDSKNPPTKEALLECDVAIVFLNAEAMEEYIDLLIEAGIPVASGVTGITWPENLDDRLKEAGVAWIAAHNFAIGMNIVRAMIMTLARGDQLFDDAKFSIHEVHHTKKLDAPSGTAVSWQEWLGVDAEITSARTGDVVGEHTITLKTEFEEITLHHSAKDRRIFAAGSVWTAEQLLAGKVAPGLHKIESLMNKEYGL